MTPQPQYHAGLCGIKDWERGLPSHSWCLYPQPHRNQEWLPWRIPHPHLCAPKTCIRGSVGDQQGPGEGRWQSGIKGGPLRSGLLGQRRDAPPTLSWAAAAPVTGSETGAPVWGRGGSSGLGWEQVLGRSRVPGCRGLRNSGPSGPDGPDCPDGPAATCSFGESYSPTSHVPWTPLARGAREGGPDPARCPGSPVACGGEAPPHAPQSGGSDIQ